MFPPKCSESKCPLSFSETHKYPCHYDTAGTEGMERQASARYGVPAEAGLSAVGQNAGAVRLYLPTGNQS